MCLHPARERQRFSNFLDGAGLTKIAGEYLHFQRVVRKLACEVIDEHSWQSAIRE